MARHYGLSPAEQEVQDYISKAEAGLAGANPRAQTLARSTRNPRAMQAGQDMLEDRERANAAQVEQQERQALVTQRQEEAVARQREAEAREEEARRVRAASAAGVETVTDIETGRRSIKTHDDGAPVFKAGPVSEPRPVVQEGKATWLQSFRDDRGNEIDAPVPEKTDPKTAERYVEVKDEFGRPKREVTGTDPNAAKLLELDQEEARVALQRNTIAQTKAAFEPRFKPVADEFKAAKADWDKLKENEWIRGNGGMWQRPTQGGGLAIATPEEVVAYQKRAGETEARWKRAEAAHNALAPQAENLTRAEQEAQLAELKVKARKIAIQHGLPEDEEGSDGGAAAILAAAATGLPVPEAETARKLAAEPPVPAPKPPDDAEAAKTALGGLNAPEGVMVQSNGDGTTGLFRDGTRIAQIDARKGTPVVIVDVLGDELRTQAAIGNTGGLPVYLRNSGKRQSVEDEAGWVAKVFQTVASPAADPMVSGDGAAAATGQSTGSTEYDRERAIRDIGAMPADILRKVRAGEISQQSGEAIMRGLYGTSMKVDDPADPETFKRYLERDYKAAALWPNANKRDRDEIRKDFVNQWWSENRDMPGVTWEMQERARAIKEARGTGDKVSDAVSKGADIVTEVGGSMAGLLTKYPEIGRLVIVEAFDANDDEELWKMLKITGRADKNFIRNLEATRQKWFTDDGQARLKAVDAAVSGLRSQIRAGDVTGNKEAFQQRLREAMGGVTEAAFQLHALNQEDGWEVTRDDFDPNKDNALGSALAAYTETGDPAMLAAFSRRLLLDKGNRQAELELAGLTEGKSKLAAAFTGGLYASNAEALIEILSDVATLGVSKAITGGAKAVQIAARGEEAIATFGRVGKARQAVAKAFGEFGEFGKVADTLATPAGKAGRIWNKGVDMAKVAGASGVSEGAEEAVAGLADPDATPASVARQAGVGAVAGLFMAPVFGVMAEAHNAYKARQLRGKQAADFSKWYSTALGDTPGFKPLSTPEAEAALAMTDPVKHGELSAAHQAAMEDLKVAAAQMEGAEMPAGPGEQAAKVQAGFQQSAASRYSSAMAKASETRGALVDHVMQTVEAAQSAKALPQAEQAKVLGLVKAANGRGELLTSSERRAIGGLKTAEGSPYFADVGGKTVFTAEGRADVLAKHPVIGALIQTDESQALIEASTQSTNEPHTEGQPGSQEAQAAAPAEPAAGQAPARGEGAAATPAAVGPAQLDAAEYEAYRSTVPDAPEVGQVVAEAFGAGRPVSVSMARAAGIEVPAGYVQRGTMLESEAAAEEPGPPSEATPVLSPAPASESQAAEPRAALLQMPARERAAWHATRAVDRAKAAYPKLKNRFKFDSGIAGVQAHPDGRVTLNLADLEAEIDGLSDGEASARLDAILGEEVIHIAQFQAAAKQGGIKPVYAEIWNELSAEQQQAASDTYQGPFDDFEAWQKGAEAVRMLVQQRMDGQVTELTKAFYKSYPARMLQLLMDAVEFLKAAVAEGEIPERVRQAIDAIEGMLAEFRGDRTTEAPAAERNPGESSTEAETGPSIEAPHNPLRELGLALADALKQQPKLTKKLRRELEFAVEDLSEVYAGLDPEEIRLRFDRAISEWLEATFPPKRQIDGPVRERALAALRSGDFPTLSAVFDAGKITPRPNELQLVLAKRKAGTKLTEREMATMRNASEWDGAAFRNQFENAGHGKVAREIIGMLMAKPGEGSMPNVVAAQVEAEMTANEMWTRIGSELGDIAAGRGKQRSDLDPNREWSAADIAAAEAKASEAPSPADQREAFDAANAPSNGTPMPVAEFSPEMVGQTVTVDGETMRITAVEMDSLGAEAETVVLEDHLRFGRQVLESGEVIYAEAEDALFSSPVEQAAAETDTEPTDGQKEAGNYRKGKVALHGMTISIENPRGSIRSGTDKGGKSWEVTMPHHYGYFLGTKARDGDHVDTFIGPDPESMKVWIVNQIRPDTGRFDESKVMLGFSDRKAAIKGYQDSYSKGWKGLGDIVETDAATLKAWLENGDTKKPAQEAGLKEAADTGSLSASPAPLPETQAAVDAALKVMPPIYRSVFEAVAGGATEAEVAKKFSIRPAAVTNILNAVRSRLATATAAASPDGLKPAMRDGRFDGGRPDLALSTNPMVAAVDQIRNESDVPGVREWSEVLAVAEQRLAADYAGEYRKILEAARDMRQLSDVEVAIAKAIIARETIEGRITKAEDRVKLAMLIHGYRDIGTETARSLAIRRDPHKKPAERAAQFIAEALFTPDEATRAELRKAGKGKAEDILEGWMVRVDAIKRELLAQGIDIEATLAAYRKRDAAVKEAEGESPRAKQAIDEAAARLTKRERSVVEALRSGSTYETAGFATGMTAAEAKAIYVKWYADIKATMVKSAQRFMAETLGASPAFELSAILEGLGVPDPDLIAENEGDLERVKKERKERAPKPAPAKPKPKAEPIPPKWRIDTTLDEWAKRPPAQWRTLYETEMKALRPQDKLTFEEWVAREMPDSTRLWQADMEILPKPKHTGIEEWAAQKLSTWITLWQTEMKALRPDAKMSFEEWAAMEIPKATQLWQEEMALLPEAKRRTLEEWLALPESDAKWRKQPDLFAEPVLETTGTFDLNDPVAMKEVINAFALARGTKMDAIMEFWKASILTGPQTHIVNAGSNALNIAWDLLPRRATEATINTLLGLVGQESNGAATFAEFAPMAKQLRRAVQLGARNALRSWQLESRTFEAYARAEAIQLDFTGVGAEYIPPALGGKIGKIMRSLSFRAMTAADEFFKSVYSQMEVAAQAHRMAAREEKLSGKAYDDRITKLMEPGSAAWIRAIDGAKRVTFQSDLDGDNPRLIRRLDQLAALAKQGRNMPWIGRPLTFFLPFIDTPLNVFKQAVEISPLGSFLAIADGIRALRRRIYSGKMSKEAALAEANAIYDRARLVQDLTNQTIAWAAVFALQGLVNGDEDDDGLPVITGTVPYKTTRRGERDNAYAVMPPQTIRIGKLQFSYARIEPFATMLASSVDLLVTMNRQGGMKPAVISETMARFKDQAKDKTFLQGISSLLNAIEDPDRFGERLGANIVTGFVPNIIRQPLREADTTVRDGNPAAGDGFFASVAKRVGYSVAPQAAPMKLDVWGQPVPSGRGGQIGGTAATDMLFRVLDPTNAAWGAKADPIDAWIFRYNLATADPKDRVAIEPIPNYLDVTPPGEKRKRVPISPQDQAQANEAAGKAARAMLGDNWGPEVPLDPARAEQIRGVIENVQRAERARLKAKVLAELPVK